MDILLAKAIFLKKTLGGQYNDFLLSNVQRMSLQVENYNKQNKNDLPNAPW